MARTVLLDAGPLGLVTHPRVEQNREAALWLRGLLSVGVPVLVPEISDYEVRRELLRAGRTRSLDRLDRLTRDLGYLPLTTEAMRLAARFWADARKQGQPTASDESLDADVILAAQAAVLNEETEEGVVVATTNPRHLSRFVDASLWQNIAP
ncbi:MAG: nuclease [Rubrobacteraceae bacterium]|nr:nuclease [Rubrobacteraceae bacterium]